MKATNPSLPGAVRATAALAVALVACWQTPALRAQTVIDWQKPSLFPRDFDLSAVDTTPTSSPTSRANRIRIFRMMPGFLVDPVGLDSDDPSNDPGVPSNPGTDWVNLSVGNDNPFFDFRRPGDPGGVGYYRVHSQLQLFDSRTTCCALNLQAVTPAGREQDGLADGPTILTPALSVYHELDDGTALQGFVGKHMRMSPGWTSGMNRSIHYGMAVQRPLIDSNTLKLGSVYWYVSALGRYRFDADPASYKAPAWELMPGLHWRLSDNWWMAAGFIMPMTPSGQADPRLWQWTCSFRF
jgi:hypothetical protein